MVKATNSATCLSMPNDKSATPTEENLKEIIPDDVLPVEDIASRSNPTASPCWEHINNGPHAAFLASGKYEFMKAINATLPSIAPKPWAWGSCKQDPSHYFLLVDFRDVGEQPPDPARFTARLAELHRKSIPSTGRFGFHTTTCVGIPQVTDTWEES
ncbi:uncharacterized protein BDV17DRAFT_293431 [Aspergillus undulatus]|uniref:uncharacterized protein n=1 Tax=Aspergillus undulatus TaxID=1810928 RepID=UPI003CCD1275